MMVGISEIAVNGRSYRRPARMWHNSNVRLLLNHITMELRTPYSLQNFRRHPALVGASQLYPRCG